VSSFIKSIFRPGGGLRGHSIDLYFCDHSGRWKRRCLNRPEPLVFAVRWPARHAYVCILT